MAALTSLAASSPLLAQEPPPGAAPLPAPAVAAPAPAAPAPEPAAPSLADLQAQLAAQKQEHDREVQALQQRLAQLETAQADAAVAAASEPAAVPDDYLLAPEPFRIYGFADFGVNHAWVGKHNFLKGIVPTDTTFVLGNLNLYFDFKPGEAWQVLTEIRFTAYPDGVEESFGSPAGTVYERTSTNVVDVASPATASSFHWGTIVIERAYAQYTASENLSIRVGQFLTPYGIWNVDHGTPTLIALMMPHFVSAQVFPARQIGVEATGSFLANAWEIGYSAYVSNGRTQTPLDFTENKAVGARLRLSRVRPLPLALGASVYHGSIDDVEKDITSFSPFSVKRTLTVDGVETGVGVDLSLDVDALRIRSEGVMRMTRFVDGKRPVIDLAQPGSFKPDNNEYDAYLLAAYQLPVWGLEPFVYGELNHFVSAWGDEQGSLSLGLNIHFTPYAQLKTQVSQVFFFDLNDKGRFSDNDFTLVFSRLAVAF
jgi:hypothetical protein